MGSEVPETPRRGPGVPPSLLLFEGRDDGRAPDTSGGTRLVEALLGLNGFRVLSVREDPGEVVIEIETTVEVQGCSGCISGAECQDRLPVEIRNLPCSRSITVSRYHRSGVSDVPRHDLSAMSPNSTPPKSVVEPDTSVIGGGAGGHFFKANTWPDRPKLPRIRTRSPHSNA